MTCITVALRKIMRHLSTCGLARHCITNALRRLGSHPLSSFVAQALPIQQTRIVQRTAKMHVLVPEKVEICHRTECTLVLLSPLCPKAKDAVSAGSPVYSRGAQFNLQRVLCHPCRREWDGGAPMELAVFAILQGLTHDAVAKPQKT